MTLTAEELRYRVSERLDSLTAAKAVERIWSRDPTVWKEDRHTPEIVDRLGWLTVAGQMKGEAIALVSFADEVRDGFDRVVLLGMGGSSLAALVLWQSFGQRTDFPALRILDSTDPRAVGAVDREGELERTLFIVASKSGTTLETVSFCDYFWERTGGNGSQFVAITDADTSLAKFAEDAGFRRAFINPSDIGGRYSALSLFGLVPAALIGVDVARLLASASDMADRCAPTVPISENPGARLGTILSEAALGGRDKVAIVSSRSISALGLWAEQLLAESTGKEGKGIIPVVTEPFGSSDAYGQDRLFVTLCLEGDDGPATDSDFEALEALGHPVERIKVDHFHDLGGQFFLWEFAAAVVGAVFSINPFDQPDVAASKEKTRAVLQEGVSRGERATAGRDEVEDFLAAIRPGDYVAIQAYLPPTPECDRTLSEISGRLRDHLKVAVTWGYGPRYLHSTGQLHKGGPPRGHFLQVLGTCDQDIDIPNKPFTFGQLEFAQAEGDYQALRSIGRPVMRLADLELLTNL